jgi:TPR repeat protein
MEQPLEHMAKPVVGAAPPAKTAMTTGQAPPHPDTQPLSPSVVAILLTRGNALLATGDVAAARLMYEHAARSYSGPAAIAMGMTYDPRFLAQIGAQGIAPDPQRAAIWYRHAADLGSAEGAQLLAQLPTANGH